MTSVTAVVALDLTPLCDCASRATINLKSAATTEHLSPDRRHKLLTQACPVYM